MKKIYTFRDVLLVLILFFLTSEISIANKYYVSTTGNNSDGSSWVNGYTVLQTALGVVVDGDTIVVAKGTYIPDASVRTVAFNMVAGVKVFGGFAGNEDITSVTIENRDFETNETILSGDLLGNDGSYIFSDNSYTVVIFDAWVTEMTNTTILDGFTISGGYANGSSGETIWGGGIYMSQGYIKDCSPQLKNLIIKDNTAKSGGGIYLAGIGGADAKISPTMDNIIFDNNEAYYATGSGGAIYMASAPDSDVEATITNAVFINNRAGSTAGGVYLLGGSVGNPGNVSVILSNATFYGNTCDSEYGSAFYSNGQEGSSEPILNNVIFYGNGETQVHSYASSGISNPTYNNCLITGSPSTNWNTDLGTDGGGNIEGDPLLADPEIGNVDIIEGSPVLNAGDITNGVNIGYYQGSGITSPTIVLVSDFTDFGTVEVGNTSAEQTFTISGTDLLNTVVVSLPEGFEASLSSGTGFFNPLNIFNSGSITTTTIYVRFKPTETGDHSGNVTISSPGTSEQQMAVVAYAGGNPEISVIDNQSACSGGNFKVAFTVTDDDLSNISFDLSSSNETIVPVANMEVTGSLGSYILNITTVTAGTADITVQVTDGSLNTTSTFFSLTITERPTLIIDFTHSICNGDPEELTVSSTGGTGTINYQLNDGGFSSQIYYDYLLDGENIVVAKDDVGCTDTSEVNNINPDYLGGSIELAQPITCTDDDDAIISVQATGGWEEYEYSIDGINYQSDSIFENLEPEEYAIHVRDSGGCEQNLGYMQVLNPDLLVIDYINTTDPDNGNNGEISVVAYGGTFPLTYALNTGTYQNDSYFTGLAGGQYSVYVMDNNGCTISEVVNLSTTGINVVINFDLKLYPNPTSEYLYFDASQINNSIDKIEIYNFSGQMQLILNKDEVKTGKIDVSDLNEGSYLMIFTLDNDEMAIEKIIIK